MNTEIIFNIFNTAVLPVWLLMLVAPQWVWTKRLVYSHLVPVAIGLAYTFLIFSNIGQMGNADFSSFAGIKALFALGNDQLIAAGWFHYLAFDLVVGGWILKDSQERGILHYWVVPCLVFTFMLGPVGLVLYHLLKLAVVSRSQKQ